MNDSFTEEEKHKALKELESERMFVLARAAESKPLTTGKIMWENRAAALQDEIDALKASL